MCAHTVNQCPLSSRRLRLDRTLEYLCFPFLPLSEPYSEPCLGMVRLDRNIDYDEEKEEGWDEIEAIGKEDGGGHSVNNDETCWAYGQIAC